jgi:hypothetical protein
MKSFINYITEMDKSQDPPGRDDPYDYGKGKWHKGKALTKDKAINTAHDVLSKVFNEPKKKEIKEDGVVSSGSAGPTNVTGPQSGTDPISATARRMDNIRKVRKTKLFTRKLPQA